MSVIYEGSKGLVVDLIAYTDYASQYKEKVNVSGKDPDYIVAESGSISHSKNFKDLDSEKVKNLISLLKSLGHESVFEHVSFTFRIEGISRVCSHQLIRHRMASYTQQSQRYVPLDPTYILPESIYKSEFRDEAYDLISKTTELYKKMINAKIKREDARFLLTQAVETKIVVTMNGRELRYFISLRADKSAQWEIRALALEMLKKAYTVAPLLFEDLYKKYFLQP
jgi:thymidylate synthase (FAD)